MVHENNANSASAAKNVQEKLYLLSLNPLIIKAKNN